MKKIKKIEGNIIQDVRNLIRLDEEIKKKKRNTLPYYLIIKRARRRN